MVSGLGMIPESEPEPQNPIFSGFIPEPRHGIPDIFGFPNFLNCAKLTLNQFFKIYKFSFVFHIVLHIYLSMFNLFL